MSIRGLGLGDRTQWNGDHSFYYYAYAQQLTVAEGEGTPKYVVYIFVYGVSNMMKQNQTMGKVCCAFRSWCSAQDLVLIFLSSTFLLILIMALLIINMVR